MINVSQAFTNAIKAPEKKLVYKVGVDWSMAKSAGAYVYTDETARCASFKASRKASKHPWGVIIGSATITLNNASQRYFPGHDETIGDYVGLPNRPVKLEVGIGTEYVTIFTGFTDRPEVSLVGSEMKMTAHDILGSINDTVSALGGQTNKRADQIIAMLLEEAGIPSTGYDLEVSTQPVIGYCAPNNKNILDLIDELCQAEQYLVFADGSGKIHGWNANHQATISGASWEFDLNNSTAMDFSSTNVLNDVRVLSKPYQPVPYAKIFSLTSASDDTLIPANDTLTIWSSLKDTDNNEIYGIDIDTPIYNGVNTSNYLTNTAQDGSGDDNHGAISVTENLVLGSTIKTTFRNSSATPTYITQLEFFGTSAQRQDYTSKRAIDKNSIATYGHNPDDIPGETYEIESDYIQNDIIASEVATRLVIENSSPFSQLTIGTFIVPQLEFGDRVEVSAGSLLDSKPMFIMGWEFEASSNAEFKQKLSLDESNQGNYFILDSSALDGGKVLAP